ncbi:MAG: valine--tRNA ligase, partial [Gammaproteobacteria bacterium]
EKIVNDLNANNLIDKIEPYTLKVPRGDRSGAVVEPYLTWQWFIKTEPLAKPAIEAVEKGEIRFVPENWSKTYFQWMHNIQDWCISRQLWWGHRIPAWYDEAGNMYVGENETEVRKTHALSEKTLLTQDNDVLDTWVSASLWPFATLGWPQKTDAFNTFYPTQVLITGFDIIFFWVARMIMMGLKFTDQVPFQEIYITGLIRDAEGHKMSKSKGNVLDPIDVIDGITLDNLIAKRTQGLMQPAMAKRIEQETRKHFPEGISAFGTDALRFTFCALASTGRDICFDLGRVAGYRNFCNKIWNAARYVLMNVEGGEKKFSPPKTPNTTLGLADRWIRSRLQATIAQAHQHFKTYRFDLLAQTLYEFTWNTYCDWYLELSKPVLTNPDAAQSDASTRYTLVYTLETLLRLLHPCMPYITEEIWQRVAPLMGKIEKTIMLQPYPTYNVAEVDQDAEQEVIWLQNIIVGIRNIRGESNISPAKKLTVLLRNGTEHDKKRLADNQNYLISLAKLDSVRWLEDNETAPPAATALAGQIEILIPLAGLIDIAAEQARLNKEVEKLSVERVKLEQKLVNPGYTNKAPVAVVEKDRLRVKEIEGAMIQLTHQLDKIAKL